MRDLHTATRQETLLTATREGAHGDKHHGGGGKNNQPKHSWKKSLASLRKD